MQIDTGFYPALGFRLKAERQRLGMTQAQVARLCGVSLSFVRDAESHPDRCTLGRLLRLFDVLGVRLWSSGWQTPEPPMGPGVPSDLGPM